MSKKVNENNKGLFTHTTDEWLTPNRVFKPLDNVFHFDLDVCATENNTKCKKFYTQKDNALSKEWKGVCWMNPPFGKELPKWMKKAHESSVFNKATVVCLVPCRTDTVWFHDTAMVATEIWLVKGRISFDGATIDNRKYRYTAPFPSCIVIYKHNSVLTPIFRQVRFEDNIIKFL